MTDLRRKSTRMFIAEWVPSLNKGELAILIGILRTFEVLDETEVSILSFYPEIDRTRYPPNLNIIDVGSDLFLGRGFPEKKEAIILLGSLFAMLQHVLFAILYRIFGLKVTKFMKKQVWKEYCRSDFIIIGHDQVSCASGFILLYFPVYVTLLARALRKPVAIYANGTYLPEKSRKRRFLTKFVLRNANLVTARGELSHKFFKDFCDNGSNVYLVADPAFLVQPTNSNKVEQIVRKIDRHSGLSIGMTISRRILEHAFSNIKNSKSRYSKSVKLMAQLIDELVMKLNATIFFLPHCIDFYKNRDDRIVAKDICKRMTNRNRAISLTTELSPEELKAIIGHFDLFIGSRVHSLISATSMCVPSLALTPRSERRVIDVFGDVLEKNWICNVEEIDIETLLLKIASLLSHASETRKHLASKIEIKKNRALASGELLQVVLERRVRPTRNIQVAK